MEKKRGTQNPLLKTKRNEPPLHSRDADINPEGNQENTNEHHPKHKHN